MTNQTLSRSSQRRKALDPLNIAREIFLAAEHAGENGLGKAGLVGYFRKIAREQPTKFFALLGTAIREKIVKQLKYRRKDEIEAQDWIRAEKTDVLDAVISAATQVGNDGRGQGGLVGYVSRFAREKPELSYDLLEMLLPYRILWAPKPKFPTRQELEKQLRACGIQVLFHGDERDENGCPISDGGPWPRIRNIHTGEEFTFDGVPIRSAKMREMKPNLRKRPVTRRSTRICRDQESADRRRHHR